MTTKVLITGGSGFIGRKIIERLSKTKDLELSCLSRDANKVRGLEAMGVRIYEGDITKPDSLKHAVQAKDVIIHCAALMSNYDMEGRETFYNVNAKGTKNLLETCDAAVLKQFIHISTAGVYGPTGTEPVNEEAEYGNVLSSYEWSKKEAENVILKYAATRNIPYTILRPSQVYGSGMYYGWTQTMRSIKNGRMLIPGDGRARIHLLHINDLVDAVTLVINNHAAINKIYNITGPEAVPLRNVFNVIAGILGASAPKKIPYMPVYFASLFLGLLPYYMKNEQLKLLTPHRVRFFAGNHVYDISKAKRELNFRPSVGLKDGFREMISWSEKTGIFDD